MSYIVHSKNLVMKKTLPTIVIILVILSFTSFQPTEIKYGDNKEAGRYIVLNGVKHYYEVYGEGQPMLLIHGNSTGIPAWTHQIPYFTGKYKIYAIDCRGRGKSDFGPDTLNFRQIAADMAAFIKQMKLDSVNVIGRSDGGIIALLMGIYYPEHIRKIVAFGSNLYPDTNCLYPETVEEIKRKRRHADMMLAKNDTSKNWYLEQQKYRLNEFQPHISTAELNKIKLPVLVMSCDRDLIQEEHSLLIYRNIPRANLCIFPDETHRVTRMNPALFNTTVETYLMRPFRGHAVRFKR